MVLGKSSWEGYNETLAIDLWNAYNQIEGVRNEDNIKENYV